MMKDYPSGRGGTCGLIAICILLGYYDRIVDDYVITDDDFVVKSSSGYTEGVTQAFHDYLFTNCLHTVGNLALPTLDFCPMTATEIYLTIVDYLREKSVLSVRNNVTHQYLSTSVKEGAKSYLNGGNPVILTLISYDYTDGTNEGTETFHNVVAYGYDSNDRFYVHYGWQPDESSNNPYQYSQIIISSVTFFSYYVFKHNLA